MARPTSTPGGQPEFMTSEAAGGLIAALLDLGVERFREQSAERGTVAVDQAAIDAGVRAVRQLREHHAGGE
jgi:hypothetical protein